MMIKVVDSRSPSKIVFDMFILTGFEIVKHNRKKCIQFQDGNTRYSLKVINGTDVIFEVSLDC